MPPRCCVPSGLRRLEAAVTARRTGYRGARQPHGRSACHCHPRSRPSREGPTTRKRFPTHATRSSLRHSPSASADSCSASSGLADRPDRNCCSACTCSGRHGGGYTGLKGGGGAGGGPVRGAAHIRNERTAHCAAHLIQERAGCGDRRAPGERVDERPQCVASFGVQATARKGANARDVAPLLERLGCRRRRRRRRRAHAGAVHVRDGRTGPHLRPLRGLSPGCWRLNVDALIEQRGPGRSPPGRVRSTPEDNVVPNLLDHGP
jgi:hypothetical protein